MNNITNRELINFLEGKNNSNNTNETNIGVRGTTKKYNKLIYENKISQLETEINELKYKKEKIKENLIKFFTLIKKYSYKLSSLTKNLTNENNSFISSSNFKEIKSLLSNLIKILNNPKLIEEIFEIKNFSNNINNNIFSNTNKSNKDILEEYKNGVDEIISKYEKKINIINKENEEIIKKINILKIENNSIKEELNNEKKNKENILIKLNKLKEENNNLEKKNKILDYKCTSYFNKSTQSRYEQKNIEEEIEYKNKIIKYLENLLKKNGFNKNEEIYKRNIHKVIDLKKNLKEVINDGNVFKDSPLNLLTNEKSKYIENGSGYINEKTISSNSFKSNNNNREIKKEIDIIDKEIEQIQSKLEIMIKEE